MVAMRILSDGANLFWAVKILLSFSSIAAKLDSAAEVNTIEPPNCLMNFLRFDDIMFIIGKGKVVIIGEMVNGEK